MNSTDTLFGLRRIEIEMRWYIIQYQLILDKDLGLKLHFLPVIEKCMGVGGKKHFIHKILYELNNQTRVGRHLHSFGCKSMAHSK